MAENIATLVARFVGDTTGLKAATDSAQRDLSRFQAQAGVSGRTASASFAAIGGAWRAMAGVIGGVSVAAGIGQMVNQAAQFERRINVIRAQSQATDAQMRALSGAVRQVGLDFGIGARSAANAAGELLKAGLSVEDVNAGALRSAVVLARALESDVAPAAQIAAIATTVFGESAENLDAVVQGVAATVLSGKFELNDYAVAMQQGGAAARLAGLSLDDFNTLLILLQRNIGGSGSDMGTLARVFLSRLVPASAEAERRMAALGLQFFNADGSARTLAQRAEELRRVFGNMSDEARAQNFNDLFGIDGLRAASALMSEGAAGVAHWRQEIERGAQATAVAAAQTDGLSGALAQLGAAWQDLGIAIAESGVFEALEWLARQAAGGVRNFRAGLDLLTGVDPTGFQGDPLNRRLAQLARAEAAALGLRQSNSTLEGGIPRPDDFNFGNFANPAMGQAYEEMLMARWYFQRLQQRDDGGLEFLNSVLSEPNSFHNQLSMPMLRNTPMGQRLARALSAFGISQEGSRRRGGGVSISARSGSGRASQSPAEAAAAAAAADAAARGDGPSDAERRRRLGDIFDAHEAAAAWRDELERVIGAPIEVDRVDIAIRRWDLEQEQLRETAERFSKDVHDAFRDAWINDDWDFASIGQRIEQAFRAALWDALLGDSIQNFIEGLAGRFARMLSGWINEAVAGAGSGAGAGGSNGIVQGDGANGLTRWVGDAIGDMLGRIFRGGFASGGQLGPGQWGVAGENGPEPIYGGRTGVTVFPAGESQNGGTTNVFHIDARGADAGVEQRIRLAVEEAVQRGAQAGAVLVFKKVRAGRTM